jgi:thymidylate synthase
MDKQYKEMLQYVLDNGTYKKDRTGTGTLSVFGYDMRFDLSEGFPAITTKKLAWKSVVSELLWMLEGSEDERRLAEILYDKPREELINKKTIWTDNADKQGKELGYTNTDLIKSLGPVYGSQWRSWYNGQTSEEYDQIAQLINSLKNNPSSRRHILSAFNVGEIGMMALPPCHYAAEFNVTSDRLSCKFNMRSNDLFLGNPFNVAGYALLTHILAKECGYEVGDLICSIGDAHIYVNHVEQVKELLLREPYDMPTLEIDENFSLKSRLYSGFQQKDVDMFKLLCYNSHEAIKAPMAV